ncbi:tetratricopeptide repeat-containing sensor histidine kinase [Chryseosolibacter indicus]|uniref:histidine kinase n=1 Tax=Chryseosolibacter indicus TaxID=2782351 RepID=A0ABS5VV62_9BACT|nr:tetratricopeptide repeat protein [Chryseosolibacter indicus]MBT1705325.1 tetratricopeptide repeat protein [Chryseosolibacter indicus]
MQQNEEALKVVQEASRIAYQLGDTSKIVNSSRIIGLLFNRMDKPNEAEKVLLEVLSKAKRNELREDYKSILNNLAIAYTIQAKYDKALDIHFQALKMREEDNNAEEISISLNNIGLVYFKLNNYETALDFYNRALRLKTLDYLLVNIGLCYNQLKDFSKAHEYFDLALKTCGENCSERTKIDAEFGLGMSYYGMNNFPKAAKHFKSSYTISKKIENKRFEAENLLYFSYIFIKQHKLDSAVVTLTECEKIASNEGYNELLIESYKVFSDLFYKKHDFEKSSHYQSKYILLKDSIYSQDLIKNLAKIQTNYAERQNLATIAAKEEVIKRQRSLNFAIIIIAVLSTLLIFVLFRSNRIKKKVNAALSEAKAIIEEQNKQLLNSNINLDKELKEKNIDLEKANESLRRVNEELDNFIYKTSHDIRGPLASLKGMCNVALLDVTDPVALGYLRKLDVTAEKLNTILTRLVIVNQINNSILSSERIDFNSVINDVLLLEKKKGLPPHLNIKLKIEENIEFYSDREFIRIILENLIDNAIKFYNDSDRVDPFVNIFIETADDFLKVRVIDNGIGINQAHPDKIFQMFSRASERSETGGIGMYITKTAVQKLGGVINLKTTSEGYTEFFVTLPLSTSKIMA